MILITLKLKKFIMSYCGILKKKKISTIYFFFTRYFQEVLHRKLATVIYRRKTFSQRWYGVKIVEISSDRPLGIQPLGYARLVGR